MARGNLIFLFFPGHAEYHVGPGVEAGQACVRGRHGQGLDAQQCEGERRDRARAGCSWLRVRARGPWVGEQLQQGGRRGEAEPQPAQPLEEVVRVAAARARRVGKVSG